MSLGSIAACGQAAAPVHQDCGAGALQICALHVLQDEVLILESPFHAQPNDLLWIAPFGAATGIAIWKDPVVMNDLGYDGKRENDFRRYTDVAGIYAPVAFSGAACIAGV